MAGKYYGSIIFAEEQETSPGVWTEVLIQRQYYGDFLSNVRRWSTEDKVNDDLTINTRISIVEDAYIKDNFHKIRYAEYMGVWWKVTSVEPQYPRLILTLGGVANQDKPDPPVSSS